MIPATERSASQRSESTSERDHHARAFKIILLVVGLGLVAVGLTSVRGEKPTFPRNVKGTSLGSKFATPQGDEHDVSLDISGQDDTHPPGGACRATGWNNFQTTWNLEPGKGFFALPVTEQAAASTANYQVLIRHDAPGSPGKVYSEGGDITRLPFFGHDGKLAGLIVGLETISEGMRKQGPWKRYHLGHGKKFWGLEFHFRKPHHKGGCTTPETIGHGVWVASKNTGRYIHMPYSQTNTRQLERELKYEESGCVPTMGMHYYKNTGCGVPYPIFLMYHDQKLAAVGVNLVPDRPTTAAKYWEYSVVSASNPAFKPGQIAECLFGKTSQSMHIFLRDWSKIGC